MSLCQYEPAGDAYRCKVCKTERPGPLPIYSNCRLRGLGDAVARFTTALGIPQCGGCEERQETLNSWLPFQSTDAA